MHDQTARSGVALAVVSPPPKRRRIAASLRVEVVDHYTSGKTSRQVADELGLGRTTVLEISKAAGVPIRPQSRKY
jgi:hypothetical protein